MAPHRRSELYRLAVGAGAAMVFAAGLPRLGGPAHDPGLIVTLIIAGVLAQQFPVNVNLNQKVSVASAVFFATALLLPAWQAAAIVAVTSVLDTSVTLARRVARTRERPPVGVAYSLVFNAGQLYFAVLTAGMILQAARVSAERTAAGLDAAVALLVAAVAMYAVNLFLVALAIALGSNRSPLHVFRTTHRTVLVEFASLYLVGTAAAFAAARAPWLLLLFVIPLAALYRSLRHRGAMRRESVLAIERVADRVDRKDPYTYQHSQRVATYSLAIARTLGLRAAEIEVIELAAKVHDIGKIGIPESILLKPDRLTADERRVMETHPRLGFDILREFSEYAQVLELVLSHHERYDGRGYPNGALGRALPLIAQVIPVADSVDAMTTARAYRGARSWDSAMAELRRGAGTQWNPRVVQAALSALSALREEEPATAVAQTVVAPA